MDLMHFLPDHILVCKFFIPIYYDVPWQTLFALANLILLSHISLYIGYFSKPCYTCLGRQPLDTLMWERARELVWLIMELEELKERIREMEDGGNCEMLPESVFEQEEEEEEEEPLPVDTFL